MKEAARTVLPSHCFMLCWVVLCADLGRNTNQTVLSCELFITH